MSTSSTPHQSYSYCSCSTRSNSHNCSSTLTTTTTLLLLLTWLGLSCAIVVGEQFKVATREQLATPDDGQVGAHWTRLPTTAHQRGPSTRDDNSWGYITPNGRIINGVYHQEGLVSAGGDDGDHYIGAVVPQRGGRARRSDGRTLPTQRRSPSTSPKAQFPLVTKHSVPKRFRLSEKKDRRRGWKSGRKSLNTDRKSPTSDRKSSTIGRRKLVIPPKFMLDLYYAYIGAQRALPAAGVVRSFTLLNKGTLQKTSGIQGQIRTRRLSFNLSSLPVEEQVTAAELRLHLTGGRERRGRGRRVSSGRARVCVLLPLSQQRPGGSKGTVKDLYRTLECHSVGPGRLGWETYNVTDAVVFWRGNAPHGHDHLQHELEVRLETLIDDGELPALGVGLRGKLGRRGGSRADASVQLPPMRLDIETSRPALQPLLVVYSEELQHDKPEPDMSEDDGDDDEDGQALPTSAVSVKVERKNGTKLRGRHKRPRRSARPEVEPGVESEAEPEVEPEVDITDDRVNRDSEVDTTLSQLETTMSNTSQHPQRHFLTQEQPAYPEDLDLATGSSIRKNRSFTGGSQLNIDHAPENSDRATMHSLTSSTLILTGKVKLHRTVLQGGNLRELRHGDVMDGAPVTSLGKRMLSGSGKSARGRGKRRRLKRGKSSKRRSRRQCRKLPMFVNFADINWHKWVIAPKGYQAFQCSGRCDFPLSDHLTPTKHAIVKSLVHINTPDKAARSCCVPTRLDPISILYVDERNVVTYKYRYQGMMVGECGCR